MDQDRQEEFRARAEQRFAGYARLGRQTQLIMVYLILYGIMCRVIDQTMTWPFHYYVEFSPRSGGWFLYDIWNYLVVGFGVMFGVCLFRLLVAFVREQILQHDIRREMELEMLRLQVQLEQARNQASLTCESTIAKPKRGIQLSSDGELIQLHEGTDRLYQEGKVNQKGQS